MIQSSGGTGDSCEFPNYLAYLLPPAFQFPRQIFFSLLPEKLGRASAEFRIIRQPIERTPPQKIRAKRVFR